MLKINDAVHLHCLFCRLPPEAVGISELKVRLTIIINSQNESLKTRNVNTVGHIGFGYLRLF